MKLLRNRCKIIKINELETSGVNTEDFTEILSSRTSYVPDRFNWFTRLKLRAEIRSSAEQKKADLAVITGKSNLGKIPWPFC